MKLDRKFVANIFVQFTRANEKDDIKKMMNGLNYKGGKCERFILCVG